MRILACVLSCALLTAPATAAVTSLIAPVVVVYPFTVTGTANPDASGRLALLFASRLAAAGGVTVKPPTPGTDRAHFLQAAKAQGADYYVTGFLTPLGDSVSLLDQVVSTYSGIVVWSNTVEVQTYGEAAGQADVIRDAILRHAGRTLAALDQPAPAPSSTPAPSRTSRPDQAQANLSGLSRIFSRRPRPTPAPRAAAAPASPAPASVASRGGAPAARPLPTPHVAATRPPLPPPPPRVTGNAQTALTSEAYSAVVVPVTGTADAADRTYASSALAASVAKAGLGGMLLPAPSTADAAAHARALCAAHGVGAIYGGVLALDRSGAALTRVASASFELVRYDCNGVVTARQTAQAQARGRGQTAAAIERAVADALHSALHPTKGGRI